MLKLSDKDAAMLAKRIAKLVRKAKYEPASVQDIDAAAAGVVAPYVEQRGSGWLGPNHPGNYDRT
jgi:hypothetical protein